MGSSTATAAKKRRLPAISHATNSYGPMYNVKFVYKDNPNEPLVNRFVLYWLYDGSGNKLDSNPADPYYWDRQSLFMPGGCSKTGDQGFLTLTPLIKNFSYVYGLNNTHYCSYSGNGEEVQFDQNLGRFPLFYSDKFPRARKVGFLTLPIDMLRQVTTLDLLKLPSAHGAWVDTISQDQQVVQIHCTLPEWAYRIKKKLRALQRFQKAYADYAEKHVAAIAQIEFMSGFVQTAARFSGRPLTSLDADRCKILIQKAEALKKSISDAYLTNTDQNTYCGKALSKVTDAANELWALIDNKDFVDEIKRYLPYIIDKQNEESHGPDMSCESGWKDVFSLLGEAYGALAKSSIGDKIFTKHIIPFFDYLASLCPDAHADWPSNEGNLIDELRKALPSQTIQSAGNPLLAAMSSSKDKLDLAQILFSPAPGLPSLFESIINAYGYHLANEVSTPNIFQASKLIRSLFGLMKVLRLGKPLTTAQEYELAQAANWGDLTSGKKVLLDYTKDAMAERYGAAAAGIFKGSMFIFALVSFASDITSDEKETLKKWTKIIASGSNLALTSIGILFAEYEASLIFKIGTGCLGIVAGLAATIVGALDARDAFHERETSKGIMLAVGAAGSLALTIGFAIMAFGGVTSPTGVGAILVLVGLIVTVAASVVLMIMTLFTKETESVFNELRKKFVEENGMYNTEYKQNAVIKQAYEEMLSASRDLSWWLLSWRAVVPLYTMGFVVKNEQSGDEDLLKTAQTIEKLIDDDSDAGSYKVILSYLNDYKKAEKNPSLYMDKSGFPDVTKWQQGTIFPDREPKPNSNF